MHHNKLGKPCIIGARVASLDELFKLKWFIFICNDIQVNYQSCILFACFSSLFGA